MAVIKFGSVVTGGRGSLGGSTIQPCHSGHIWRNKPTPTKSRTQAQSVIRSYNKAMQAGWKALSDQDRKVWNDYAKEKPVFNRTGEKHPLSGHSLWMKYQFDALQKGAPFMSDPSEYPGPYLGVELITDPYFLDSANWFPSGGWVVGGGQACYTVTGHDSLFNYTDQVIDKKYRVVLEVFNCPGTGIIAFYASNAARLWKPPYWDDWNLSNGIISHDVVAISTSNRIRFIAWSFGDSFCLSHFSIREIFS